MTAAVLAIDGGNSKTDVCLISADGQLLGYARGPGSNHQNVGVDAAFEVLLGLVGRGSAEAGIDVSLDARPACGGLPRWRGLPEGGRDAARTGLTRWLGSRSFPGQRHVCAAARRHQRRQPDRGGLWRGHQLRGSLCGRWATALSIGRRHLG